MERAPRRGQAEEDKGGQAPGPAKAGPVHMGLTHGVATCFSPRTSRDRHAGRKGLRPEAAQVLAVLGGGESKEAVLRRSVETPARPCLCTLHF